MLCDVSGSGAWLPTVNFTSFPDVEQTYSVYYDDVSDKTPKYGITYNLTANRTLNEVILDYQCETYFPEPNFLPADVHNRHYSRVAPVFMDSCSDILLMDVQCKI